jgi:hypothetical protein
MSLLGKIFTFAIFVATLVLMLIAMLVYATHTNWQQAYTQLNQKLQTAQALNTQLESKYQNDIAQLKAEREAAQQDVRKLETERTSLLAQNAAAQDEVDDLRQERQAATATVRATEENNNKLTEEVVALRGEIRGNQAARDTAFTTTLRATSELHTVGGQLQAARERVEQLVAQVAKYTLSLRERGIDPDADVVTRARGQVNATRRAQDGLLVEISIGYDDGVREDQTVEIFRGDRYLGRAIILRADPDRAVGRVLREFQQGQIQEGDDVATQLRVG